MRNGMRTPESVLTNALSLKIEAEDVSIRTELLGSPRA